MFDPILDRVMTNPVMSIILVSIGNLHPPSIECSDAHREMDSDSINDALSNRLIRLPYLINYRKIEGAW